MTDPVELTYDHIVEACMPGGASVLTSITPLRPAAGFESTIAPARYVQGSNPAYAYETRFIDGEPKTTVMISSKQDQLNRIETAISEAIRLGESPLARIPRIRLRYGDDAEYTDLELPHRAFDGHVRAGSVDGKPVTANQAFRAARDATNANMRALLDLSPATLIFGGWDSTRRSNQVRCRSALVGGIDGVLADQSENGTVAPRRGGARVDPVGASFQLDKSTATELLDGQQEELSPKLVEKLSKDVAKLKGNDRISGSVLGLGALPPKLEALGGVACSAITRAHVLSFATLRQYHFGGTPEADASLRAVLAGIALAGLARSDAELYLRANCDLVEDGPSTVLLDARHGNHTSILPITPEVADGILAAALDKATAVAGLDWHGQVFEVAGKPELYLASSAEGDDESDD